MKKLLLITITLFALGVKAQTSVYHPFPDSNAVWNVTRVFLNGPCSRPHSEIFSYTFSGDTNINGNIYHKLFIPYVQSLDTCPPLDTTAGYAGCVSQDTVAKKVYFITPNGTTRQILYDFSLQVGGKFSLVVPNSDLCYSGIDSITTIDSILIGTDYRKRWNGWYGIASYIEGIGFTGGLLEPCSVADGPYYTLTCFSQNGITLFHDTSTTSCNTILSVKDVDQANISVNISPNPFHTSAELIINIDKVKDKNLYLQIYDVTGRQLFQQAINSQTTTLNRNMLSNGIYFYRVQGIEEVARGKFVIN